MMHDRQMIIAAGFDNYQTKPISVREFLDAVRATLDRRTPSADAR
jgi:DNA-binding response OmpR family regulator